MGHECYSCFPFILPYNGLCADAHRCDDGWTRLFADCSRNKFHAAAGIDYLQLASLSELLYSTLSPVSALRLTCLNYKLNSRGLLTCADGRSAC